MESKLDDRVGMMQEEAAMVDAAEASVLQDVHVCAFA